MYLHRYVNIDGIRKRAYSWKLVKTDPTPQGRRDGPSLRGQESQIQKDLQEGIRSFEAQKTTINELFDSFIETRKDLGSTMCCKYICLYNKHIQDGLWLLAVQQVRYSDIQRLHIDIVHVKKLKISTVQAVNPILYQIFETAARDDWIRKNPTAGVLTGLKKTLDQQPNQRPALSKKEQERLIEFVYRFPIYNRWEDMFTVLLGTGMRIGEVLGLCWEDCDFTKNLIDVNHALLYKPAEKEGYKYRILVPKTVTGVRTIPMFAEVKRALLRERQIQWKMAYPKFSVDGYTGFIFLNHNGKAFTPNFVFETTQGIANTYDREESYAAKKEKGDPAYLPKLSAHVFRYAFCTRMCENEPNGTVVQDVMGHKSVRTTMDVCNETTQENKIESFRELEGKIKLSCDIGNLITVFTPHFTPFDRYVLRTEVRLRERRKPQIPCSARA